MTLRIAGAHKVERSPHYAGKRAQEAVVETGAIPFATVPSTQFHDLPAMVASWLERDGKPDLTLLHQPIAPADVTEVLAPRRRRGTARSPRDIAGPDTHDLVDMARRTLAVQGEDVRRVPTWHSGVFDAFMARGA